MRNFLIIFFLALPASAWSQYDAVPQKRVVTMPGLFYADTSGHSVGMVSSTILTITPGSGSGEMNLGFNRPVGKSMAGSLPKIKTFLKKRIGGWPVGERAEIRFEHKYSPKDGDSASVVCTLLIYSALTSYEINPDFCVTGSMDAQGKVKPIGGLTQKIQGVQRRGIPILACPIENYPDLQDLVLQKGLGGLDGLQVFTLEHFSDAMDLASVDRSPDLAAALEGFGKLQNRVGGNPKLYRGPQEQAALRRILELAPNHASARLILETNAGKLPQTMTLRGAYTALEEAWKPMQLAVANGEFGETGAFEENLYATSHSMISRLRPLFPEKARPLADAVRGLAVQLKNVRESPPTSRTAALEITAGLKNSDKKIEAEMEKFQKLFEETYGTGEEEE